MYVISLCYRVHSVTKLEPYIQQVRACTNKKIASHPSIAILQAPASFLTVSWFAIGGSDWVTNDDVLISILFSASTFVFAITVISVIVNRAQIFSSFSPWFAGFTFPTVSTTKGAMFFAEYWSGRSGSQGFEKFLDVWSITYSCLLMPMILSFILYFVYLTLFNVDRFQVGGGTPRVQKPVVVSEIKRKSPKEMDNIFV